MEQVQVNQSTDQKPTELNGAKEPKEETSEELLALKKQLEDERKEKLSLQEKNKDLSVRLTKEQQVRAEFERFHTATLPKLNKAMKSFDEQWTEEPEAAVDHKIKTQIQPLDMEVARMKAQTWFSQTLVKNPTYSKYETRVLELSDQFPQNTHTKEGIEALFKVARAEDLEKEVETLKLNKKDDQEKERTFTESPSAKTTEAKTSQKVRLDAAQQEVADKLGIPHEAYAKWMGKVSSA